MPQQTFPVSGKRPRVVLNHIEGDLTVRSWERKEIALETAEPVQGLSYESDTLTISDYRSAITLWIPAVRDVLFFVGTTIKVNDLVGRASIEGASNVEIHRVSDAIVLENTYGNVMLSELSETARLTKVGGNLQAASAPFVRVQNKVGGNVVLEQVRYAEIDVVGGNLEARRIEEQLRCERIGGNGRVHDCPAAAISIDVVGGNLEVESASAMHSSTVGGNLHIYAYFPPERQTRLRAGGNASIILPDNPHVRIYARAGGSISGSTIISRVGNTASLLYGDGRATLEVTTGGNLTLQGNTVARSM